MSVSHGAKVEVLDQIADDLGNDSQTVDQIRSSANTAVAGLKAAWMGPDMDRFSEQWSTSEQQLVDTSARLEEMAKVLRQQADQQRETSGDGGGIPGFPGIPGLPGQPGTPTSRHGDTPWDDGGGDTWSLEWFLEGLGIIPKSDEPVHIGSWLAQLGLTGLGAYGAYAQYVKYGGSWLFGSAFLDDAAKAGFARWGTIGKWGGVAGGIISGGVAAWEKWNEVWGDPNLSTANEVSQIATVGATTGLGAWGGATVGASWGAAIGSVFPGPGTAIGMVVGGAIGGFIGSGVGQWIGNTISDEVGAAVDWVGEAGSDAIGWVGDTASDVGGWVGDTASDVGDAITFWN